jgi:hypothetical protein
MAEYDVECHTLFLYAECHYAECHYAECRGTHENANLDSLGGLHFKFCKLSFAALTGKDPQ